MERFFGNRKITLYASGTAALAQAIADCAARKSVSSPEAILPAYGCPDLVAACIHASVYPRLVDVGPSTWSYEFDSLKSGLSRNTVAIVAVNLLGIGDCSVELTRVCRERRIPLIQDSAQYLPREPIDWPGDYVVLSFGRGKPMNLLHGGALIEPPGTGNRSWPNAIHYTLRDRLLASRAAAVAFNVLTRPAVYRGLSALPGTGLGQIIYKPLRNATPFPERAWRQVGAAFSLYCKESSYSRDIWAAALAEWSSLGIEALGCGGSSFPSEEPLRLALLAPDQGARNMLVDYFNHKGLGASRFYDTDLTNIAAIPEVVKRQGSFPQANALARLLFTLPTHCLVTTDTVKSASAAVRAWHSSYRISRHHHKSDSYRWWRRVIRRR
jgi:hypothetical protein